MKKITNIFLVIILVCMLVGCSAINKILPGISEPNKAELLPDEYIVLAVSQNGFDRLDDAGKHAYREICTAIQSKQEKILLSTLESDVVDTAFQAVFVDHPEYFYVDGYQIKSFGKNDTVSYIELYPAYTIDKKEIEWREQKIASAVEGIVGMAKKQPDDYSKAKFVYETIVRTTDYDENATDSQNIYSVFNNKKSVCAGYARAMQLVLNKLGIECTYVIGTDTNGNSHAWNMANLDGAYYHMDATFGDPIFTSQKGEAQQVVDEDTACTMPTVFYQFFAMTDEFASFTHNVGDGQNLPKADSTQANYFVREGHYFDSYSIDNLRPIFFNALEQNKNYVSMQFASEEAYATAIKALFAELDIGLLKTDCRSNGYFMVNPDLVTYFKDDATKIITIMLY